METENKLVPSVDEISSFKTLYEIHGTLQKVADITGWNRHVIRKYYTPTRNRIPNKEHVKLRRVKIKEELVAYKGGKCSICGYNKHIGALSFHHTIPSEKEFNVSHKKTDAIDKLKKEVDKCVLVCMNCHSEIHAGLHKDKGL